MSRFCSVFVDQRFQRTGSASMYDHKTTERLHLSLKNTIDSRPVQSRCACTDKLCFCTTELCLSVGQAEEEKQQQGRKRFSSTEVNVCEMYILSIVKSENTSHPCSTGGAVQKLSVVTIPQSSPSVQFVQSRIRSPSFFASDCLRNPFRCFVKRSASVVLRVHSTHRQTFLSDPLECCKASYFDMFESAWSPAL